MAHRNLAAGDGSAIPDVAGLQPRRRPGWSLSLTVLLLLLSISGAVLLTINNWTSGSDILRAQQIQIVTFRILALMQNAETGQRGYLLTGKKEYLEPYDRALQRLSPALDDLSALAREDADLAEQAANLSRLTQIKLTELRTTLAAFDRGGIAAALPIVTTDQGRLTMAEIQSTAREILQHQSITLSDRTLQWRRNSDLLIVTGGLAVILTVIAAALIIRGHRHHAAAIDDARAKLAAINIDLEAHVADRTADLKEANEEVQRYAHITSHDMRAPLVNIMGYSGELEIVRQEVLDLLRAEPAFSPDAKAQLERLDVDFGEALTFIRQSTDKMNRLINAILTLARSGQREFRYEDVDVTATLESIKATLQHQLTTKASHFDIGPMPAINSDKLAIEQIFGNLAENAVKYLAPDRPGRISVMAQPDPIGIAFIVSDNGRGIARKDLGRIFDPFRRAGPQDQPGEGIGLAHVRSLIRRLGGRISCESDIGVGSRFIVSLPLHRNDMWS